MWGGLAAEGTESFVLRSLSRLPVTPIPFRFNTHSGTEVLSFSTASVGAISELEKKICFEFYFPISYHWR